jgi:CHAP domain
MGFAAARTPNASSARRRRKPRRRLRRLTALVVVAIAATLALMFVAPQLNPFRGPSAAQIARADVAAAEAISPLRGRIVQIAEDQVGYTTDPSNTYCNKYSAYWYAGSEDCGNSNRSEEWCADFAAWVWQSAGADVDYQFISGDLNSSSASFYEWGVAHGTWHSLHSGYVPQPGDVAVYGLDTSTLVAQHVAIVVSDSQGEKGPDVVNGDGDHTGFSVVEVGNDEYKADAPGVSAYLSGYVSPTSLTS